MATPKLTDLRYFKDGHGVRWRVYETGKVERWAADSRCWVESSYRLDELVDDPEITEVGGGAPKKPAGKVEKLIRRAVLGPVQDRKGLSDEELREITDAERPEGGL